MTKKFLKQKDGFKKKYGFKLNIGLIMLPSEAPVVFCPYYS